jgi:hypothetical protein
MLKQQTFVYNFISFYLRVVLKEQNMKEEKTPTGDNTF